MTNLAGLHDREAVEITPPDTWVLDTIALSENPPPHEYKADLHWICRANWGYGSTGTLPASDKYGEYVGRLVAYVRSGRGCSRWIVGNEPSLSREWPDNKPIYPANYADCYRRARAAIHALPGHERDEVLIAASGPWNNELKYAGNPNGDWIQNFVDTINACDGEVDGFSIHGYTHGYDPSLVSSEAMMDAPFQNRHFHFRTYRDYLNAIPTSLRGLPVYLTEANGDGPWRAVGLMTAMLDEINRWNQSSRPPARCVIFYRYPKYDQYHIQDKDDVIAEYRAAVERGYQSPGGDDYAPPQSDEKLTQAKPQEELFMPSISPGGDRVVSLPPREWDDRLTQRGVTINTPALQPGDVFWRVVAARWFDKAEAGGRHHIYVEAITRDGHPVANVPFAVAWPGDGKIEHTKAGRGFDAGNYPMSASLNEFDVSIADGVPSEAVRGIGMGADGNPREHTATLVTYQLATMPAMKPVPSQVPNIAIVNVSDGANIRVGPGTHHAVRGAEPYGTQMTITGRDATGQWWYVEMPHMEGWVSATVVETHNVNEVPVRDDVLPSPEPAPKSTVPVLAHPVAETRYRVVSQPFDARPEFYSQYTIDGVSLKGHEGIDFATPVGTPIAAVDGGTVVEVADQGNIGYGRYIKLVHPWGESVYAHLQSQAVNMGEGVNKGQSIGRSGNTGNSSGPHLHFGLRVKPFDRKDGWGGYEDPAPYLINSAPVTPPAPAPAVLSPANARILSLIKSAAQEFGLDWRFVASLAWYESSWLPTAKSPVGAMGIMQIMPPTWAEWSAKVGANNPYNERDNIRVGAAYLAWLIKQVGGNEWGAVVAYNFGIGNVLQGVKPPAETSEHATRVLKTFELLGAIGDV